MRSFLKDDKLAYIHDNMLGNIAQYISVGPDREIRNIMINGFENNRGKLEDIILKLINSSNSKAVNIRSFSPTVMKGNELVLNKRASDISDIILKIEENCTQGRYSIINENIDICDGGVSGVVLGNVIEFAPKDTPKCVDKDGVCLLEKKMGYHLLKTVYGFSPEFNFGEKYRVEFSIHPNREGVAKTHTIIWEYEEFEKFNYEIKLNWPNRFSEFIGDKTFGLLIADYLGFNVPYTTVIARTVAPFSFGKMTGLKEKWIRTAPVIKEPGKYYTSDKWTDPFSLIQDEEKKGDKDINIAAILSQQAVEAVYSGGAIISEYEADDVIEGVTGKGDCFMLGTDYEKELPDTVLKKLGKIMNEIRCCYSLLGTVSIEWVYDGKEIWILQMSQIKTKGHGKVIVHGEPTRYEKFLVVDGLEKLRSKVQDIKNKNIGIELVGDVGICSHFGDILRHSNIPSFISSR